MGKDFEMQCISKVLEVQMVQAKKGRMKKKENKRRGLVKAKSHRSLCLLNPARARSTKWKCKSHRSSSLPVERTAGVSWKQAWNTLPGETNSRRGKDKGEMKRSVQRQPRLIRPQLPWFPGGRACWRGRYEARRLSAGDPNGAAGHIGTSPAVR